MKFELFPYGKPFNMILDFVIYQPVKLGITVFDSTSKQIYAERKISLEQNRKVLIKLPIVPDQLTTKVSELTLNIGGQNFRIDQIKIVPDTRCPIELTETDKKFIRFIKWFATNVSTLEAGKSGTLYQSEGFTILYLDKLEENGKELTTPARIARDSGVIEISKNATQDFTLPMLIVMLLHEYSHKWKNPQYGRKVSNELSADIIAIHIALNLGFDANEIKNCFKAIFTNRDTTQNRKRMLAIEEFIKIFKRSETKRCKL